MCIIICDLNHTMELINCLTLKEKKLLKTVSLKKEEILFNENDRCEYVGIVESGIVTISSFSYNGNEIVFNLLKKGDMFGNNLIFTDTPFFKGNIIAKTRSTISLISKQNLIKILQENTDFLTAYLEYQSLFSQKLNSKIKLLSFDSAEERFLYFLFINKDEIHFSSVTSLASELSLKRETLSRLISKLLKDKRILRSGNIIRKI